jgi:hypothetical protein
MIELRGNHCARRRKNVTGVGLMWGNASLMLPSEGPARLAVRG